MNAIYVNAIHKRCLSGTGALLALGSMMMSVVVTTQPAQAQTFTTIHSFCSVGGSSCTDGNDPAAGLIQATNGDLYGATDYSGASGDGTVFKITAGGKLTTLHTFQGADGDYPNAPLLQATNGDLYGATYLGGANSEGAIFKMTTGGTLTTLYSFCSVSACADGAYPYAAALVEGSDGNLYGTTAEGGAFGAGTVFRISPNGGTPTTVYSFCSLPACADGETPTAGLIQGADGNFYGTAQGGGANTNGGTIFKITPAGILTTLYSFCSLANCADGEYPEGLIQGGDGNLYGPTEGGGANGNDGTVFQITTGGTLTTLYSFCSLANCADGQNPQAGLIQATDGNLYGTTYSGGANQNAAGGGTVFQMSTGGALTTLHSFCSTIRSIGGNSVCKDGSNPQAALAQDTNGDIYGTTIYGGAKGNYGTVFSLSMGLSPFVALQTTSGAVGAAVKILGTDLTGATGVYFGGTDSVIKADSASEIAATVPTGAVTGTVQVVTPGATLISNVVYTVAPKAAAPAFSPKAGTYADAQSVSLTDKDAGAVIYYTKDGTTPPTSPTSSVYTGPITVSASETLNAVAIAPGHALSAVKAALYTIESSD